MEASRWTGHDDPRSPGTEIGGWLYRKILREMDMTEEEFRALR